jgi:hypothetical protein
MKFFLCFIVSISSFFMYGMEETNPFKKKPDNSRFSIQTLRERGQFIQIPSLSSPNRGNKSPGRDDIKVEYPPLYNKDERK